MTSRGRGSPGTALNSSPGPSQTKERVCPQRPHLGLCEGRRPGPPQPSCCWPPRAAWAWAGGALGTGTPVSNALMSRDGSLAPLSEIPAFRTRCVCLIHLLWFPRAKDHTAGSTSPKRRTGVVEPVGVPAKWVVTVTAPSIPVPSMGRQTQKRGHTGLVGGSEWGLEHMGSLGSHKGALTP